MSGYLAQLKAANSGVALLDPLPKLSKGAFGSNDSSPGSTFSKAVAANAKLIDEDIARPAIAQEAAELRRLVSAVVTDAGERAEALAAALGDVDAALTSYRVLARAAGMDLEMRRCCECAAYSKSTGICGQAAKGFNFGPDIALSRKYSPPPLQALRCIGFLPLVDDEDQRPGHERWPFLNPPEHRP